MGSLQGSFQTVPAKVFTAHNLSLKLFLPYSSYLRIYNINQTYTTNNNISRLLLPKGWDLILAAVATWLVARVNQFNTLDYSTIKYFVNSPVLQTRQTHECILQPKAMRRINNLQVHYSFQILFWICSLKIDTYPHYSAKKENSRIKHLYVLQ